MAVQLGSCLEVDHAPTLNHVFTEARGHHLEYQWLNEKSDATPLVFLHEGLGSIDLWRDFPSHVAVESNHPALVYSRYGHGHSDQLREPRTARFIHDEAQESLPGLIDELVGRPPILVGHSDGASISVVYAGLGYPVEGLVLIAPHVMVETLGLRKIRSIADSYKSTGWGTRLSKYHDDTEGLFRGWANVWLSDSFASWNIEEYLSKISCPILMIQSKEDGYGSLKHLDIIESSVSGRVTRLEIEGDSHSPHLSSPDIVKGATVDFIAGLDFTSP